MLRQEGFKGQFADLVTQFIPDRGPPILRRWGTANYKPLEGNMVMTLAQLQTLETFYETNCANEIALPDPFEGPTPLTVVFLSPPSYRPCGGGKIEVSFKFGVKP